MSARSLCVRKRGCQTPCQVAGCQGRFSIVYIKYNIRGPPHRIFNCKTCLEKSSLFYLVTFALSVLFITEKIFAFFRDYPVIFSCVMAQCCCFIRSYSILRRNSVEARDPTDSAIYFIVGFVCIHRILLQNVGCRSA